MVASLTRIDEEIARNPYPPKGLRRDARNNCYAISRTEH